jgi:putative ABC transport system permease protein
MFRFALKNLRANATRLVATATAVIIGIAFLAAGLMLTDAMKAALEGNVDDQYAAVDLVVRPAASLGDFGGAVPADALPTVRDTPGVAAAAGELSGPASLLDRSGEVVSSRSQGRAWIADRRLNPLTLREGRAPEGTDEVVIDRTSASDAGLGVGDRTAIGTPKGRIESTVVGISEFGDQASTDDGGTLSFAEDAAIEILNTGVAGYDDVLVRTASGTSPSTVRTALSTALPRSLEVVTGATFRTDQRSQNAGLVDLLRPALQGFAYLALFVAGFVIFNTFSVVVTQRFRELALIRAVGGTPGQVRRSLLFEGLGIGVVASAIGIVVGALLALALQAVLGWIGITLPGAGVSLSVGTVVLCMVMGTVVTLISVAVPAFRAGRTKPVEAMRDSAVDTSGTSKARAVIGGVALVVALVLLLANRLAGAQWYLLAPGALLLFVGLVVGGPLLARLFATALERPARHLGLTARLAVDNTVRNPRRTATTANALVIGLFLVTLVTVSGDALKTWTVDELNKLSSSDFIVAGDNTPVDPTLVEGIRTTEGVAAAAPVRSATVLNADNQVVILSGADVAELRRTSGLKAVDGSLDDVAGGAGAAVVDIAGLGGGGGDGGPGNKTVATTPTKVGQRERVVAADGSTVDLPIVATLEPKIDSLFLGTLVSEETLKALAGDQPISQVYIRTDPGQANAVGARLDKLVRDYAGVQVQPGNFLGEVVGTVFDFLIGTVNALLGMSVIIALVGIVNTLTLSIFERRRELGMVRALGMTNQQVSRMVRGEAVLIGILGTCIGLGAGLLLGWVVIGSISGDSIPLSINWARLGLIALAGVVVGVLASILPGRRAVRMDMLEAMSST